MMGWAYFSAPMRNVLQLARAVLALCTLTLVFHVLPAVAADGEKTAWEKIQQRGTLTVALYKEFAPFSDDGRGIDLELAQALAAKLGVKLSALWFTAGEKVDDDLRKMVWRGTPIGFGPADFMMHVPVDRQFMARVPQVKIFAPYYRERFGIGRSLEKLPVLENLDPFEKLPLGVEGESLGALVMMSADSGRYREKLKLYKSADEAIAALKAGTVVAALGQLGELESGLRDDPRFAIDAPPQPVLNIQQWVLGLAVKAENEDLANALEVAMSELMTDGTVRRIMQSHGVKERKP
jgi:ABC-type amino acid transport substrate-binding protein